MVKVQIQLKKKRCDFTDYDKASKLEEEARAVQEEAKSLEGCEGVYWEVDFTDEYSASYYWVFYRYETEEELAQRTKKEQQRNKEHKIRLYEQLKKELDL